MSYCRNGHIVRGAQDRYSNGNCKKCHNASGARYRATCRAALRTTRAAEALDN